MATGRGNNTENQLQQSSQTAMNTAGQVNPLQQAQQDRIKKYWDDLDSGKDVSQISYLAPYYNLYNSSKAANQDYAGEGLLGNNQLAGTNTRMLGVIGKQMQARREEQSAGDLYNASNQAYGDSVGTGMGIANADTSQRLQLANMANQRYTSYLNRPRRPSIWEQLLGGAMNMGASYVSGGMAG